MWSVEVLGLDLFEFYSICTLVKALEFLFCKFAALLLLIVQSHDVFLWYLNFVIISLC